MKVCSKLLCLVTVVGVSLAAQSLPGQGTAPTSLVITPADHNAIYDSASLAVRVLGLSGSKEPAGASRRFEGGGDDIEAVPKPGFYPMDMSNPGHGPTVINTENHPIYINQPPSHWGNVSGFLDDLGRSNFIHLLDQYVGTSANNRYTLGASFLALYPIPANHTLGVSDILALVHAAGKIKGNGFGHLYHVFIPSGVDMCIDAQTCYSPDNPPSWVFCAFHASVTFQDIGHVIFSVEPFQNVVGCSVPPTGTPNGQLADSTNNVLSHEIFEALSDPDGTAWWVHTFTFANGEEIGDLCIRAGLVGNTIYWNYGTVRLNNQFYTVQPEYSNQFHGCAYTLAGN